MFEMKGSENTIKLIQQVEQSHKGLGLSVDFTQASVMGQLGLMLCGLKESGKSTIVLSVHELFEINSKLKGAITLASMGKEENQNIQQRMSNNTTLWTCEDLVHSGEMSLNNTLKLASGLIDKGEMYYQTQSSYVAIGNAKLAFLGCATFDVLQMLMITREWIGNYSERFFRYYVMPFMPFEPVKNPPIWKLNPKPLFGVDPLDVDVNQKLPKFKEGLKLFESQISPKRAKLMYVNWLSGHALFNHRKEVLAEDIEVLLLSFPNIKCEKWFARRPRPSLPKYYDLDSLIMFAYVLANQYQFPIANTVKEISDHLDMSEDTTRKYLTSNAFLEPYTMPHNKFAYLINKGIWTLFRKQQAFIEEVCKN